MTERLTRDLRANLLAFYTLAVVLPFVHLYTYQTTIGRLPFIGGLIPALTLLGFLPLLWLSRHAAGFKKSLGLGALFLLFYLAFHVVALHSSGTILGRDIDGVLFSNNMLIIYKCFIFLVVGISFQWPLMYRKTILAVWALMVISALSNVGAGTLLINLEDAEDGMGGLYLFLGDSFAIWSLLAVLCVKPFFLRVVAVVVSVVVLFVLTSRTSLYAFIVAEAIVLLALLRAEKPKAIGRLLIMFGSLALFVIVAGALLGFEEILQGRMFRFLSEGEDDSWSFRQWQLEMGLKHIEGSPIFGDYGSHVRLLGRTGDYIHSYLEIWRQFGILPFAWVVFLVTSALYASVRSVLKKVTDERLCALSLIVFTAIEVSTARSWGSPYVFLAIGVSLMVATNMAAPLLRGSKFKSELGTRNAEA